MEPLKAHEIYGNWATLLLPLNADDSINYKQLEHQIDVLIACRVNGIYSNGTAGEFYNQTEEEFDRISELLAEKCNAANRPFQIGCSHMSPQICMERLKRILPLRPSAVQIILPDWFVPTMAEIIDYLKVMAEAAGSIGLVLYNPPHAKKKLSPDEFYQIKEAGISLVGCKVPGGDEKWYADMKSLVPDLSLFVPGHYLATGIRLGANGAYSNVACLNPLTAQKWYEMMHSDLHKALELESRIQLFMNQYIVPYITVKGYSNQAVDKFLAAVGGWSEVGTRLRWPYHWINEEEVPKVREACQEILPEFFTPVLS